MKRVVILMITLLSSLSALAFGHNLYECKGENGLEVRYSRSSNAGVPQMTIVFKDGESKSFSGEQVTDRGQVIDAVADRHPCATLYRLRFPLNPMLPIPEPQDPNAPLRHGATLETYIGISEACHLFMEKMNEQALQCNASRAQLYSPGARF